MGELKQTFDAETLRQLPYIIVGQSYDGSGDIEVHNLTVKTPGHNGKILVNDLSLTLKKGEKVILTGPSGSGKTTVAKAFLNQWDHGSGLVIMPAGTRIMALSQQAYFPNTTIRGILNLAPEGKGRFSDRELADALRAVGHEKLVQQIPGQQVEVLIDDLAMALPGILEPYRGQELTADLAQAIRVELKPVVDRLVHEQFNHVQFVPKAQREALSSRLAAIVPEHLKPPVSEDALADLTKDIAHDIDIALAYPLYDHLAASIPDIVHHIAPKVIPFTAGTVDYFTQVLEKKLGRRLDAYMANKDTDDLAREIRINRDQAAYIAEEVTRRVREELQQHVKGGALSQAFNAATWPVSLATLWLEARSVAGNVVENTTFFMERQVLTGDKLTLSGGERQKLMFAMVLLHKPDILILDEITAALDRATAEKLYREMIEQIPQDTTVISIAHNEHIMKYHTVHAHLDNQTITLTDIRDAGQAPENGPDGPCKPCP